MYVNTVSCWQYVILKKKRNHPLMRMVLVWLASWRSLQAIGDDVSVQAGSFFQDILSVVRW